MSFSNFERMLQLADEVFAGRTDPNQLNVDEDVINRLKQIHPATISEYGDDKGPAVWILVFPTTTDLMNLFLEKKISEKELFDSIPLDSKYEALYLCSALVLPEYRGRGIAKKLTLEAIENIKRDHPIKTLFVWPFSKEGESLAEKLSTVCELPLRKR